jgi:hypothetical protein
MGESITKDEQKFYTTSDIAAMLGVHENTVINLDIKGLLKPSFKTPGGHRRYSILDYQNFTRNFSGSVDKIFFYVLSKDTLGDDLKKELELIRVGTLAQRAELASQGFNVIESVLFNDIKFFDDFVDALLNKDISLIISSSSKEDKTFLDNEVIKKILEKKEIKVGYLTDFSKDNLL